MYYLYIIQNTSDKLYVGISEEPQSRLQTHNDGQGANATRSSKSWIIVHVEPYKTLSQARQREIQVKKWSRQKKLALIAGDTESLIEFSKSQL